MIDFLPGGAGTEAALAKMGWGSSRAPGSLITSGNAYTRDPGTSFTAPNTSYGRAPGSFFDSGGYGYQRAPGALFGGPDLLKQPILDSLAAKFGTTTNGSAPTPTGTGGGDWATINQWDDAIAKAQAQIKAELGITVPADVAKSIMKIESNGVMLGPNQDGAVGLMQLTPNAYGSYDYSRLSSDPYYNVYAGMKDLAYRYLNSPSKTWDEAAVGYFSGHYTPNGARDAGGQGNSDYWYLDQFRQNLAALGGGTTGAPSGGTGGSGFAAIWGGQGDHQVTQPFGWTDFARNSPYAQTAYAYTADYTRDRQPMGHAGVDVGMDHGTSLYAPVTGRVVIAGGSGYYCDEDEGMCGPGHGELAIEMANGDQIILGHMRNINLTVGQTVSAGTFVGTSGGENGGHVHVEYRKWVGNGVTNSGYEVVDPQQALGGAFTGSFSGGGGNGVSTPPAATVASPNQWFFNMVNSASR